MSMVRNLSIVYVADIFNLSLENICWKSVF
jgi:hypothetical protein